MAKSPPAAAPQDKRPTSSRSLALEYIGFRSTAARREYVLRVGSGADAREFVVWIAHAAFAARQLLLQDGPDICYQKLRRELAADQLAGGAYVGVTDSDLTSYREAHTPPARRPP